MTVKDYFTLEDIIRQIIDNGETFTTEAALRERFKKLMKYLKLKVDKLKNQKGEIFFYEHDVPFTKALLLELGEPYLQRLTSNRMAKSIDEGLKESAEFRARMLSRMEQANPVGDDKKNWEGCIEILSRTQLLEAQKEIMRKIKLAGDQIVKSDLTYNAFLTLLQEVDKAVDTWAEKRLKS